MLLYFCTRKQKTSLFSQLKMPNEKKLKNAACIATGVITFVGAGVGAYVLFHNPSKVKNPCWRTFNRADGIPKKAFTTRLAANWQSIKQFLFYGEICNSYEACGKFYTGHSK